MSRLKVNLRNRCIVLKALATIGPTDSGLLSQHIGNDLTLDQVRRAIYTLLEDDEIEKVEKMERKGSFGRPMFVYAVRDPDVPRQKLKIAPKTKKGRQNYSESLRRAPKGKINTAFGIILYRDRKVRLLKKLIEHTYAQDRDLIYGLLADLGCTYESAKGFD